jgi:hypothetical protein
MAGNGLPPPPRQLLLLPLLWLAAAAICAPSTATVQGISGGNNQLVSTAASSVAAAVDRFMQEPLIAIRSSLHMSELGYLPLHNNSADANCTAAVAGTETLRRWLYQQTLTARVGTASVPSTMLYVGLEDGRFLGYFSASSYTFRARANGSALGFSWSPAPPLSPTVQGPAPGHIASDACPAGAARSSAAAPCTLGGCCDRSVRGYFSTSRAAKGVPLNLTKWKAYDHRARPWCVRAWSAAAT